MPPKKRGNAAPVAAALAQPEAQEAIQPPLTTFTQSRSKDGCVVRTDRWEAICIQNKSSFRWQVKNIASGNIVPLTTDDDDRRGSSGFAAFVSNSVLLLVQDKLVTLYSLPEGAVLLAEDIGYQTGPRLIGQYLLMTQDDGGDDGSELTVYDLSPVVAGAPKSALKTLKLVKWSRVTSRQGIAARLRKKPRTEGTEDEVAEDEDDADPSSSQDVESKLCDPRRAYPNWGVEVLGDGWLATIPAGDEAPNRYGQQHINVYCLKGEPRRVCDIPSLHGDVGQICKRGDVVCVAYQDQPPDFWDIRRRRFIACPTQQEVAPFCTNDALGRFFSAAVHNYLVAAAAGDTKRIRQSIEVEQVDVDARGLDPAICHGYFDKRLEEGNGDDDTEPDDDDTAAQQKIYRRRIVRARGKGSLGPTALSLAVGRCDAALVKYLLSKGASASLRYRQPYSASTTDVLSIAQQLAPSTSRQIIERRIKRALAPDEAGAESEDDVTAAEAACKPLLEREKAMRAVYEGLNYEGPAKKLPNWEKLIKQAKSAGVDLLVDTLPEFGGVSVLSFAQRTNPTLIPSFVQHMFDDDKTRLKAVVTPLPQLRQSLVEAYPTPAIKKLLPASVLRFHEAVAAQQVDKMRAAHEQYVVSGASPSDVKTLLLDLSVGNMRRPSYVACSSGNAEMLRFLIAAGQNLFFDEPSMYCAEKVLISAVRKFFNQPEEVAFIMQSASDQLRSAPAERLTEFKDALRHAVFLAAVAANDTTVAAQELDRAAANGEPLNIEISCTGFGTALQLAMSQANSPAMAKMLLERGANPVIRSEGQADQSILQMLCRNQVRVQPDTREAFLELFSQYRSTEDRLGEAVQKGDVETACRLICESGADVNCPLVEFMGATPLHIALDTEIRHQLEMIPLLLRAGANPHARFGGDTAPQKLLLPSAPDVFLLLCPNHPLIHLAPLFAAIRRADPEGIELALQRVSPNDVYATLELAEKSTVPYKAAQQHPTSPLSFAIYIFLCGANTKSIVRSETNCKMTTEGCELLEADALRVIARLVEKSSQPDKFPPFDVHSQLSLQMRMMWKTLGRDIDVKAFLQWQQKRQPGAPCLDVFTVCHIAPRVAAEEAILILAAFSAFCRRDVEALRRLHAMPRSQFPGLDKLTDAIGRGYLCSVVSSFEEWASSMPCGGASSRMEQM